MQGQLFVTQELCGEEERPLRRDGEGGGGDDGGRGHQGGEGGGKGGGCEGRGGGGGGGEGGEGGEGEGEGVGCITCENRNPRGHNHMCQREV